MLASDSYSGSPRPPSWLLSAMPSDNESIRITGSRFVGGNYTRHEHGVNLHTVLYSTAEQILVNFVKFISEVEQEMLFLCV